MISATSGVNKAPSSAVGAADSTVGIGAGALGMVSGGGAAGLARGVFLVAGFAFLAGLLATRLAGSRLAEAFFFAADFFAATFFGARFLAGFFFGGAFLGAFLAAVERLAPFFTRFVADDFFFAIAGLQLPICREFA